MLLAIDHGNYNIKTPHHCFMAGLAEHSVRPPMADEVLEHEVQLCRSLEMGVITMNNDIIRRVNALHDMRIEDEHISAVLAGKETILPEAVKKTIRESAGHHAKDILDKLRELQVDLRANPAVFIGGGSILFREYLEKSSMVASATFLDDPCANAIGYKVLAEAQRSLRTV